MCDICFASKNIPVRCALFEKKVDVAEDLVNTLRTNYPNELQNPEVKRALAALELETSKVSSGEEEQFLSQLKENPTNLEARYNLALSLFKRGQHKRALDECFELIKQDKKWNEEAARKLAIKIFDALGPTEELVKNGRKRLSNLWFT